MIRRLYCRKVHKLPLVALLAVIAACTPAPQPAINFKALTFQVTGTYFEGDNQTILSVNQAEAGVSVSDTGTARLTNSIIIKYGEAKQQSEPSKQKKNHLKKGPGGMPPQGFGQPSGGPGRMLVGPDGDKHTDGPPGPPPFSDPGEMHKGQKEKIGERTAAVFASGHSTATIENVRILTSLKEGKGLCAIGDKTNIVAEGTTIITVGESSHGTFVAEGANATLTNMTILTSGDHSSAVATDQGGGTIIAKGGNYMVTGKYSAGIYSTGKIDVTNATITASKDNAVVIEGGSSANLKDCRVLAHEKGAVMIYQSFSGDAALGASAFRMQGGSVTALQGPLFYLTNTTGRIDLDHVSLHANSDILLKALKGDWGVDLPDAKPSRGADVALEVKQQAMKGDIVIDEYSHVDISLTEKSNYDGAINPDGKGHATLTLDSTSHWKVSADSYLDAIRLPAGTKKKLSLYIEGNGHNIFYNPKQCPQLHKRSYPLDKGGKLLPRSV